MKFSSTRDQKRSDTLSAAISKGLASDGGLFVPEYLPQVDLKLFNPNLSLANFAQTLLHYFFAGDELEHNLKEIIKNVFTFPLPLTTINSTTFVLELFHGPTSSFKDIGTRFLAECISHVSKKHATTILVATSGDTGSAVASAFYLKRNVNVIILYPKGKISPIQEHQITCWDNNIIALAVEGTFDRCQHLVKIAFQDPWWQKNIHLNSANSINIGRLLPQIIYYAYSSMQFYHQYSTFPGYIIPTGNLGNAVAGYYAKKMGFPIREIVLATNANLTLSDYLAYGHYKPRESLATLANAMDVGNPSNFERLNFLFKNFDTLRNEVNVISADDNDITNTIKTIYNKHSKIICPHTATAFYARKQLSYLPWIIVATADPGKFDSVIRKIIHESIPLSPQLQTILAKPAGFSQTVSKLGEIETIIKAKKWSLSNE
ncbi:MAG: threonine synthase [Gammaproteobacteria bacterium]|nr:threonine synthase [Gammaproteobacteria bacterium]